jgi:hypothetical protein
MHASTIADHKGLATVTERTISLVGGTKNVEMS